VPGLVLALHWPGSRWTLLDAGVRRAALLTQAVSALGLADRVDVLCARAEDAGRDPAHRGRYDLVTARSFGAPAVTAECGAALLHPGGILAVTEPPDGSARWPDDGLALLGLTLGTASSAPRAQLIRANAPCPERYPRRTGVPAKRPLF
jgi:16S rRNA (guanine527-N7)-methyltransferase